MPGFGGSSATGNFAEALDKAFQRVLSPISHTDPMVSFKVLGIPAEKGDLVTERPHSCS